MNAVKGVNAHPIQRVARQFYAWAAGFALLAGIVGFAGSPLPALTLAALAAFFVWAARTNNATGPAVQLVNLAHERLTRGQVEEAEAMLARAEARALRHRHLARAIEMQRSMIALHRGDAEGAIAHATRAIEGKARLLTRYHEEVQIASARSLRALAHASLGHAAEARRDADAAEANPSALPVVYARAALARAVVFASAGDVEGLASHFAVMGGRLMDWLTPRERALFRALRRMARARPKSVYREAARPDEVTEEGRTLAWIEKLAPGASAFAAPARHAESADARPVEVASAEGMRDVEHARKAGQKVFPKPWRRVTALWALLIVLFLAIWQFLSPTETARRPAHPPAPVAESTWSSTLVPIIFVLVWVPLLVAWQVRRTRRDQRNLILAQVAVSRGETKRASDMLTATAASRVDSMAASARASLAGLAERHADWLGAIAHCDAGIARATRDAMSRAILSDRVLPELVEQRAVALAALGRRAESDAELAVLTRDFPTYGLASRAIFRAKLVGAARAGDLAGAAEIARERTLDLPLSMREDMLADVVLACVDGAASEEIERIDGELRDDAEVRGWLDAVAPGLRDGVHRRVARTRVAAETVDDEAREELDPFTAAAAARPARA